MGKVVEIVSPAHGKLAELARLSANMDDRTIVTKFAIVASDTFAYGMGQIDEAYRNPNPRSTKAVRVFRSMEDAMDWMEEKRMSACRYGLTTA